MSQNKDLVLYHGKCYDGFGAAFAAWKALGDNAKYIPMGYGNTVQDVTDYYNTIYISDFSFDEATLLKLKKNADKIVLLDHHKTAEEMLKPLIGKYPDIEIYFDMNKSGALMTWEYFHGTDNVLQLIKHISDRDLWQFKLDGSREIHAALLAYPMSFKVWDSFNVVELEKEGQVLLKNLDSNVAKIVDNRFNIAFEGMDVPVVNTSIAWSEVGNKLVEETKKPFVMSFTDLGEKIMFSLRSIPEFDCTEIAKKYGGGGHKNASGFKVSRTVAYEILEGKRK